MVMSGLLLLARYQAIGAAKKLDDWVPASPSLPACWPAARHYQHCAALLQGVEVLFPRCSVVEGAPYVGRGPM
eukprot:5684186-Pyramimonas_sp.AAC.1